MPELKTPQEVINSLTAQYDAWARKIQQEPRNTTGVYLETDSGSIYVRNMARGILSGDLVVCLAGIQINNEYQGKGILKGIIRHIEKNPYAFSEFEIENIQTKDLLNTFINKGFSATSNVADIAMKPITVFKRIKAKHKDSD